MTHAKQIQLTALINHCISLWGLWYLFSSGSTLWISISIVMLLLVPIFAVNIGLHRFICHRSFKTGPLRQKFLTYVSIIAALGAMGTEAATNAAISGGYLPLPIVTGSALIGKHIYNKNVAKQKMNKISEFINYGKELP